jgi:hypothetical protein
MLENYREAAPLADDLVRRSESKSSPTGMALYRIEHALALAGLGHLDGAVANGSEAFKAPRLVKSIINRAGDLDSALQRQFPNAADARDFHEHYLELVASHGSHAPKAITST